MLGLSDATMGPIKDIPKDDKEPTMLREFMKEIHGAMLGEHIQRMNKKALSQVGDTLNSIDALDPDSLYLWL